MAGIVIAIGLVVLAAWYQFSAAAPNLVEPTITLPSATPSARATLAAKATATPTLRTTVTPRPKAATAVPTATPTPGPVVHVVRSGEMLLSIAYEYDTSVEKIMMVNEITDPTTIQIGQQLLIPVTATPTRKETPRPTPTLVFHVIEPGDTLLALALKYDTTVEALEAANWISDPSSLQLGQKLLIPDKDGELPDPILWAPTVVHEVASGDTILALAEEYGSSVEDIMALNPALEPSALQIGQQIAIPLTRQKPRAGGGGQASVAKIASVPALTEADLAALKAGSPSLVGLEQSMVEQVNAERQARDLPLYRVDEQLTLMAWGQAQDMVKRGYFSHVTPEGLTLRDRFQARGLPTSWVGENIYLSVKPANQAVGAAVGWFMGDVPHRRNLLHAKFNRIGVGVAQEANGWYTFVLVFAGD